MDPLPLDARLVLARLRVADLHRHTGRRHLVRTVRVGRPTAIASLTRLARIQVAARMPAAPHLQSMLRRGAARTSQRCC